MRVSARSSCASASPCPECMSAAHATLSDTPALVSDSHAIWPRTPHLPMRVRVAVDALAAELPDLGAA